VNEWKLHTLHLLRDHPWSTASQVAGLANLPLRSVQRYLSRLISASLAQAARVPRVRGKLYAPSADGIAQLAGGKRKAKTYARAFRIDSLHLAETLLRAHCLMWARDFLTTLVAPGPGGLQWAVSPWEARSGRTTLRLDAYGCVLWMGRYVPFAVLADPGGLAVEGYAGIFGYFVRWAGGAGFARGVRPALVMLTTYTRRALQLSVLWRDVTGRLRDVQPRSEDSDGTGRPARKMMWPGLRAWRKVDDFNTLTWCFEGLGRMPPGTQRGLDLGALSQETQAHSHRSAAQRRRRLAEQAG